MVSTFFPGLHLKSIMDKGLWCVPALVLITGVAFFNSLPGDFHFDDFALLLDNPRVTGDTFGYLAFLEQYGGRPLTLLTFHWNHRLAGAAPFSYLLINLLLHMLAVTGVFLLAKRFSQGVTTAFGAALIFAIHPLQTQAVNYIWSRSILLMACFGLLSLLLVERKPWLALIAFQLAMWSRLEAAFLIIPLMFLRRDQWVPMTTLVAGNTALFLSTLARYRPLEMGWSHPEAFQYWLAQPVVLWKYLGLMLWPLNLNVDHDMRFPSFWVIGLSCLALLGAVYLIRKAWKLYPFPAMAGIWLGLCLLPSWLIPNSDLLNEGRCYMALIGFSALAAWLIFETGSSALPESRRVLPGVILLCLVLLPLTVQRNSVWKDDLNLWSDAAVKSPHKPRTRYNLGVALIKNGQIQAARVEFEAAIALQPGDHYSYAAAGYCAEEQQEYETAFVFYSEARRLNENNEYARSGMERVGAIISKAPSAESAELGPIPERL
jgi:protein O-mannosyl-transferase